MKKIAIFLFCLLFSTPMMAQQWAQKLPQDKVQKGEVNFHDMQKAFYEYWEPFNVIGGKYKNSQGELVKAPGWKQFKRWEWYWEPRVDPQTGEFPTTSAWEEMQKFQADNPGSTKSTSGNWTSVGPTASPGGYAGLGRINCVGFHPTDNNTIYAGSASGGLWKTTNGGTTWSVLNDNLAVLGVSDICISTANPNTIYIATGDKNGGSVWSLGGGQYRDNNSIGVMKSTDGGATWNTTGLSYTPSNQKAIFRLLMDPIDNTILYAATSDGFLKTINAGANWTNLYSSTIFCDLEFKPGTSATIYGSNKSGEIYRSIDGGATWTSRLTTGIEFRRVEMAVSPHNADYVYAVMEDNLGPNESPVYKSIDGGATFTRVFTSTSLSLLGYECNGSDVTKSQASYDLTISADPTNADIVFVGGINVWKSTDGGSNWIINTHWSSTCSGTATTVHADQHYLAYQPVTNHLFLGNDGGLYKTTNTGASWSFIGNGIVNSQLYRIGVSQTVASEVIAGLQDNGTKLFSGGIWDDVKGGDGMECIIDYTNANIQYGTYVEGQIDRTTDHWANRTAIQPASAGSGAWVTPYIIDPTNSQTLYAGYSDVWKTTNSGNSPPTWIKISTMNTSTKIRSMAIAPSNTQILYVADPKVIWKTTDGGTNWANITAGLPVSTNDITYISVKADDPLTVWVTFGGYNASKVYQTVNGGDSWTDISAGLPSIPVMCVIQNKQVTSRVDLYAATDAGVFLKAGNANWQVFSTGLPNVLTTELEIYYDANIGNNKLYAGTYGRGLWVSDLYESGVLNPTIVTATASSTTQIDLSWALASGNNVMLAYNTTPTFGTPVDGTSYAASSTIPGGGTVLYNGSNTSFNHTSLNQNTTYYYKIWSKDGSTTYSTGVTTNTTTFCTLVSTFPWAEGFEGGVIPNCWTQQYVSGSNNWQFTTSGVNNQPATAHAGTYLALSKYVTYANENYKTKLISPPIDLTQISVPFLSFWHTQNNWEGRQDALRVYYKTSINGAWNLLATYTNSIASWTQESIALPNPSSAYFIAFESTVNAGYGVCLDDIEIGVLNPTAFEAGAVSTNLINLNWSLNSLGNNVMLAYSTSPTFGTPVNGTTYTTTIPGGGTVLYSGSNTAFNHTSLNPNTTYYYKIWSFDGSTEYSSGTTANATTLCESVKVLPFTESFENATFPPQCWTTIRGTNNLGTSKDWIRATTNTYSSPGAAFVDYENVTGGLAEDWMVSPGILLPPSGTTTLSFYERQTYVSNYGSMYYLKVSTTSQDVRADFTDVMSYNETTFGTTYTQRSIDLSGKNGQVVYIAFVMTNDDGDSWYVDNVSVSSTSVFWTGATNSNWNTTTNWSSSIVPTGASNLVIPDVTNQPVINTGNSGLCNDITIHPEVVVTINPVAALTVNGTFTNNSGTSGLLIKSDASGTGSLIHSTANISGTFERFMNDADFTNWKDGWHLISSPVSAQAIAPNFTSPTATDYDFYTWYEAGNQWVNYKNTSNAPNWLTANNNSLNFQVGKGYMAAYNTEATKQFSGILNTSDVTISDLAISGGTNSSWHLLGNPFSAALTWDASSAWNMTNIAGVAKVWNEAIQSYIDLTSSPSSIIPSTNGFTVQVLSGTGGLAIPASKRVHSTQAFYKSAEQYIKLIAHNIELGNAQESNVIITPNATEGFDLMYDGEFLAGYGPQFYSLAGDSKLSTNSLPALPYSTGIPFVFMSGEANNFRIEVKGLETLDTPAWLFDKKTNTDYKLSENNAYTFSAKPNDDPNRFLLHFSGVGQNEQFEKDQVKAWFYEQHLFVTSQSELSQLELIDLQGRVLFSKKLYGKATHSLSFDYPTGCYIVRISDNKQLKAIKIVVY